MFELTHEELSQSHLIAFPFFYGILLSLWDIAVIPAQAGIQTFLVVSGVDSRLRGNDRCLLFNNFSRI